MTEKETKRRRILTMAVIGSVLWAIIVGLNLLLNPNSIFSMFWIILGGVGIPFAMYLLIKFGDDEV